MDILFGELNPSKLPRRKQTAAWLEVLDYANGPVGAHFPHHHDLKRALKQWESSQSLKRLKAGQRQTGNGVQPKWTEYQTVLYEVMTIKLGRTRKVLIYRGLNKRV